MSERVVVEYLHQGDWVRSNDYPLYDEVKATEFARDLWRQGVEGVRLVRFRREVILEHIRSADSASPAAPRSTGTTLDQAQ